MTAREIANALYARHYASAQQMPGPWTVIEEWRGIDVLAFSAWESAGRYARVGYEVKVSRSDLRRELLEPGKRQRNVGWCNEFYFAVPRGLLTADELVFEEPDWPEDAFRREACPNRPHYYGGRKRGCSEEVPVPTTLGPHQYAGYWKGGPGWTTIPCRTCGGKGYLRESLVERDAPTCWVPRDVGLIVVDGRGTRVAKKSPKRREVPGLSPGELGQLVRWISMRPDPRHLYSARQRAERLAVPA